ncbi:MAG: hypothetical protein WAW42_05510, partial [Candidatus Competibacteraceae bacterium]
MADHKKDATDSLHKWRFFRSGGFDQVRLETGADLKALAQLDPKLWAALSCPTSGLEIDSKTLELIDSDGDGRIRLPEIVAAVQWATSVLKNPDDLTWGFASLPLDAIDDSTPEGADLLASARQILINLGKEESTILIAEDTADTAKIFANTRFNGDGVVPAAAADSEAVKTVIEDIIACVGAEEDRGGEPGLSQEKIDQFFAEAQAYADWWAEGERDAASILPLGAGTEAAETAFERVKSKVDDYFTRCRLAAFDLRAAEPLNPALADYEALGKKALSPVAEEVAALPLAKIEADKPLPLDQGLNPAWVAAMADFRAKIVQPLLGAKASLDTVQWAGLCAQFAAHEAWLANKQGAVVEPLGIQRVRTILVGGYQEMLTALVEKDKALTNAANAIDSVDRLVRYHRDLFRLLNNFVSFRDFYTPGPKAIFQVGTLFLDGRSCELCIRIEDIGKHSGLANLSGTYLAYCECQRQGGEKMTIVAAFTNGDADNLMVGRNGVFFDHHGQDWDATIVKIIEHPISVRQAFWYPYKRIGKMIGEQIEKMAAAREKAVHDQAAAGVADAAQKTEAGKAPAAPPFDVGKFAGIFAAIGLAIGAIGTAIASVVTGFLGMKAWQMPLALVGLVLVLSGPSMVIAYLKLRKRNLAPLLDANGWAINTRAIINIPFGTSLTRLAALPPGAQRSFTDPFAEKKTPWKSYLFLLLLVGGMAFLWHKGRLQEWWGRYIAKDTA